MAVAQSTYTATQRAGLEGQFASEWGSALVSETRVVEGTAGIGFGRVVSLGTAHKGAVLGGAIANVLGVSIRDIALVAQPGQTVDLYQNGNNMGVMNEGDMWVTVLTAVTEGNVVTYSTTTGQFAASGGTNLPGSRWLTTAASGGIAAMRLTRAYHNT